MPILTSQAFSFTSRAKNPRTSQLQQWEHEPEERPLRCVLCLFFSANLISSMCRIEILLRRQTSLSVRLAGCSLTWENVGMSPVGRKNIILVSWKPPDCLESG